MTTGLKFVAVAATAFASSATLAGILHLDVNALSVQSVGATGGPGAFGGLNHTGALQLSSGVNSQLADLFFDGVQQNIAFGQLQSFTGTINLVNGGVTGGSFSMTLNNGDTFNTSVQSGAGQVANQILPGGVQGFSIDGLTFGGVFSGSMFAGADITPWFNAQPLNGSFINFGFNPNSSGFDAAADLDIFLVPTPAAGGVLGLAMLGLSTRRRRA